MSDVISYEYDPTGENPANYISREPHVLTEINDASKRTLILSFSPFYHNNFLLEHRDTNGVYTPLTKGTDYDLTLRYLGASEAIGKDISGGVTIHREFVTGTVLASYQCLGGKWSADRTLVLERFADAIYNPRVGSWDVVTNVPDVFPPLPHTQALEEFRGLEDLIAAVTTLTDKYSTPIPPSALYSEQVLKILAAYEGLNRRLIAAEEELVRLARLVNQ